MTPTEKTKVLSNLKAILKMSSDIAEDVDNIRERLEELTAEELENQDFDDINSSLETAKESLDIAMANIDDAESPLF
jgi:hypothetical protein